MRYLQKTRDGKAVRQVNLFMPYPPLSMKAFFSSSDQAMMHFPGGLQARDLRPPLFLVVHVDSKI
jgi:hypothetical protein